MEVDENGQYSCPLPSRATRSRLRLRRTHRRRHPASRVEPTVVIQPGVMVELALRELGAVLIRAIPPEA